ncbi:MAG: hypothetical protein H6625_08865 [Bdellovibrionaceae bacterium]|nr:hypothetical protein [Pseudobdellovibrionaceae bacterium]
MKHLSLAVLLILTLGCSNSKKMENGQNWPDKMQRLAQTMTDLLPFVYSSNKFEDPANKEIIKSKMKNFAEASHKVPKDRATELLGKDPLVTMSIEGLEREIDSAISSFDRGNYRYSRHLLTHTMNYCFACHTRTQFGPKYDYWDYKNIDTSGLNVIQKSQIMVATRQFDKAKEVLKSNLLTGTESSENPYFKEQAIKNYLSIVVKAEQSPEEGYKFVKDLMGKVTLPVYLARNVESWENSFMDWLAEKKKGTTNLLNKAKSLIESADIVHTGADSDSKYVDYLRASTILHEELAKTTNKKTRAEVLYYLGIVYGILSDSGFWELPDVYFEYCIRELPNSKLAKTCFSKYEQDIIVGYSGSAGTFIPSDERKKLAELKALAGFPTLK